MKIYKSLPAMLLMLASAVGFSSCDNEFDYPPVVSPDLGGNGAWDAPLSVDGVTAYYTAYYSDAPDTEKNYWATGFIVGCVQTTETVFVANDQTVNLTSDFSSNTNMLLASTPDETDYTKCIAIQLPSGDVRSALNLQDHPENLGRQVTLRGYIDKYLGIAGMRQIAAFNWGDTGIDTGEVETGSSEFTLASAVTSGRCYALVVNNGAAAQTVSGSSDNGFLYTTEVTVADGKFKASEKLGFMFTEAADMQGTKTYYITDYQGRFIYNGTYNNSWSNRTYVAPAPEKGNNAYLWKAFQREDGTWAVTNVASGLSIGWDTSYEKSISLGLYKEFTDIYKAPQLFEMANDPVTVPDFTPVEPGTPDTPAEPGTPDTPAEGVVYQGLLEDDTTCDWTFDNILLPEGLDYVWAWKNYKEKYYLNGSAYKEHAYDAEAVAFTEIDLSGIASAVVNFEHAAKFQTTLKQLCYMVAREKGENNWTRLEIPTWPGTDSWTFVNSGEIDLSAFAGKKIQLGFHYGSTANGADTWEVKNLIVTAK